MTAGASSRGASSASSFGAVALSSRPWTRHPALRRTRADRLDRETRDAFVSGRGRHFDGRFIRGRGRPLPVEREHVGRPLARVLPAVDQLLDEDEPELADRPLVQRRLEVGRGRLERVEGRARVLDPELDLLRREPDRHVGLAPWLPPVGVHDHVGQELLGGEHAVVDGRRGDVAGQEDPLDPALGPPDRLRLARDHEPPGLLPSRIRHDIGRPVLDRQHREIVARPSPLREALDGVHEPGGQGRQALRLCLGHDPPEPLQAERDPRRVERLGHAVRAEHEGVTRREAPDPHREPAGPRRGRGRGRRRRPGPTPCRRAVAAGAARAPRWRTGPRRSRRRARRRPW